MRAKRSVERRRREVDDEEGDGGGGGEGGGWEGRMGIHPERWPDSRREGFEWVCAGTRVRTHDW